jgi:hypothetical protein
MVSDTTHQHVVIVTGGRDYPRDLRRVIDANLNNLYVRHGNFVLFHGACQRRGSDEMTGADRYADDWAQSAPGIDLRRRPADWENFHNSAGPRRNEAMVAEAVGLAPVSHIHGLAFPDKVSRGTWNCVARMYDAGITVNVWDMGRAQQWLAEQRAA